MGREAFPVVVGGARSRGALPMGPTEGSSGPVFQDRCIRRWSADVLEGETGIDNQYGLRNLFWPEVEGAAAP